MTYGRFGTFTATPGRRDDLAALLLRAADALRTDPGCRLYLVATTEKPDEIAVVEEWTDSEAHAASLTSPAVRALIAEAGPLIGGMGAATVLDVRGGIGQAWESR